MPFSFAKHASEELKKEGLEREKAEAEKARDTKPEGKTVRETLSDKKESYLFGEYLNSNGRKDLMEGLVKKNFGSDQASELNILHETFLALMERCATLESMLDNASFKNVVASSPELKSIAKRNGTESIRAIFKEHLRRVAIENPNNLDAIARSLEAIPRLDKETEALNAQARQKLSTKYGLDDVTLEAIAAGNIDAAADAASVMAKRRMETIPKKGFIWKKPAVSLSDLEEQAIKDIEKAFKDSTASVKQHLGKIEDARKQTIFQLAVTLSRDQRIHQALLDDLAGEYKPEREAGPGFMESMRAATVDKKGLKEKLEKERQARVDDKRKKVKAAALEGVRKERLETKKANALAKHLKDKSWENKREEREAEIGRRGRGQEIGVWKRDFERDYDPDSIDDADRDLWTQEFKKKYKITLTLQESKDIQDEFNEGRGDEIDKEDFNLDSHEYEDLSQKFRDAETTARFGGGQKGTWSSIAADFFKEGFGSIL